MAHQDHMTTTPEPIYHIPNCYKRIDQTRLDLVRQILGLKVSGKDIPPPITSFIHMKLPRFILKPLKTKGAKKPTPIQAQAIPIALSGRDLIAISFTGSGKTMIFVIPMVLKALEMELRASLLPGEGPFTLVVCPSRELALQTNQVIKEFTNSIQRYKRIKLFSIALIGGITLSEQIDVLTRGIHMVVGTPGRLNDLLNKELLRLHQCIILCLDEADRLIDLGFESDVRSIIDGFTHPRQTILTSATMSRSIQAFAFSALLTPIIVRVGLAGSANKSIRQTFKLTSNDGRLKLLLEALQKTPPPVLIFCENRVDVDVVQEYLLLKGVNSVCVHGGLSQEERRVGVERFRRGERDVLVATDVVGRGLDFGGVRHVICYEMAKEIGDYVHRIGRGVGGISTTFITRNENEATLLDLRTLLEEAEQEVPLFLKQLTSTAFKHRGDEGCSYCGGWGHRDYNCPKMAIQHSRQFKADNGAEYKDSDKW